jgi:hypothetical protein
MTTQNADSERLQAKFVTRDELRKMVGSDSATGVVFDGVSPEDRLLFDKRVREQGQPSKPNRAARRSTARLKAKAITKKRQAHGADDA